MGTEVGVAQLPAKECLVLPEAGGGRKDPPLKPLRDCDPGVTLRADFWALEL